MAERPGDKEEKKSARTVGDFFARRTKALSNLARGRGAGLTSLFMNLAETGAKPAPVIDKKGSLSRRSAAMSLTAQSQTHRANYTNNKLQGLTTVATQELQKGLNPANAEVIMNYLQGFVSFNEQGDPKVSTIHRDYPGIRLNAQFARLCNQVALSHNVASARAFDPSVSVLLVYKEAQRLMALASAKQHPQETTHSPRNRLGGSGA